MVNKHNPDENLTLKKFFSNIKSPDTHAFMDTEDYIKQRVGEDFLNQFDMNDAGEIVDLATGKPISKLKLAGKSAVQSAKMHPWATAAGGVTGALNIAGLFDNDKVGGQLLGAGAGLAIPALLAKGGAISALNPGTAAIISGAGGALGSLFDKLRAKKEAEQQAMYQQQSY